MKALVVLLFIFPPLLSKAQKSNYIITSSGDTVYGNYSLHKNQIEVTAPGGGKNIFEASGVRAVYSDKNIQLVWHGMLRTYSDNIDVVQSTSYRDEIRDTTLLLKELYTTEKMNLYFGTDRSKVQYYFVKRPQDSIPFELLVSYGISKPYGDDFRTGYNYSMLSQQRIYIDQLKEVFGYCPKISEDTWNLMDYRVYSFKKIIRLYNTKCK